MSSLILGTAGHVDHGKTALVRALTGVDTDRLKEEKERGITIELGFAELDVAGHARFGVVDVPGHEDFVRAMVAGAAGMDVVLLVVAADEGVMPQTREHLSIVEVLAIPELVVALTKCDIVDEEWLELVDADVADLLSGTRYADAARIRTSATRGVGFDALLEAVLAAGARVKSSESTDLVRLPVDRVFVIQGTGTVATGTLWSGTLKQGDRVRILPVGLEAKVRGVEVHGREVVEAHAGERTAVSLSGDGADRSRLVRGATLVTSTAWSSTWMVTVRVDVLAESAWGIEQRQRVRVHHGTAEVLARCALLDGAEIRPGESGWVQLRLEEPLAVRGRDRIVLRSYSPVATIAGAVVAEALPPKRNRIEESTGHSLSRIIEGSPCDAILACLDLGGWAGVLRESLPVLTGLTPSEIEAALPEIAVAARFLATSTRLFDARVRAEAEERVKASVSGVHAKDPLRPSVPLSTVRGAFPPWSPPDLPDAVVERLVAQGGLEAAEGGVRIPGHRPTLSLEQEAVYARMEGIYRTGGLGAPAVEDLPDDVRERPDLWSLLRRLESSGTIRLVADGLYLGTEELDVATERVRSELGGKKNLGPAHFRDVLPVTRKRLLPLLAYFDGLGVTIRRGEVREVPS